VAVVIAVRGPKMKLATSLNITAFDWHFHDKPACFIKTSLFQTRYQNL